MPKLAAICLRSPDPEAQKRFYLDVLGMHALEGGMVGYSDAEAGLLFEAADGGYRASTDDLYWKISISVPNIDLACAQLAGLGIPVSEPGQFKDVGFVAHLEDSMGFQIELIEHWFQGDRPDQCLDSELLGGGPHLSLLTLRCHDAKLIDRVATELEMTPLCIIPVPDPGFTLYFYGYPSERPPASDLHAVENRTWVYRRPYTVLEVLHRDQPASVLKPVAGSAGYHGAVVAGLGRSIEDENLLIRATIGD